MEKERYSTIIFIHKYRKPLAIIVGSQIVAVFLFMGLDPYEFFGLKYSSSRLFSLAAIGGTLVGTALFMSMYLDTTVKRVKGESGSSGEESVLHYRELEKQNEAIKNKLLKLEVKLSEYAEKSQAINIEIEDINTEEIQEAIHNKLLSDTSGNLLSSIKREINGILSIETEQRLSDSFLSTKQRLLNELESLSKRAKINLIIGSITALAGVAIFISFVLEKKTTGTDATAYLLSEFAPRISLVLVIEIFAYFFLGLYKSNLSEIKYFQNEITNIEAKHIAIMESNALGDKETITKCLLSLSETERNFLIKKGESTVSLEERKLLEDENSKAFDLLSKVMSQK